MTAAYSNDLRIRVVEAIEAGLSRRAAAERFGVSVASAVRWHQRFRQRGDVSPDRMGGDRWSHRAERHAKTILSWIDAKADITIPEIRERLARDGHQLAHGTVWRLLDRHDYTRKKRPVTPASKSEQT